MTLLVYGDIVSCVDAGACCRPLPVLCSDISLFKDASTTACSLNDVVRQLWSPSLAHHESHVWELVLDLAVGEADTGDEFIRYVNDCSDLHRDILAFLVVLSLRLPHLGLVAADEQSSDMMTVWELPSILACRRLAHQLEVVDHLT